MHRFNRHRVKSEKPETSTSHSTPAHDYDLTYYIHDRVELMHQVFSVLKHKDLKAMAPECVRHISIDDLQELCTEELLGISSKRLCAILDGADPPSDTDSSSESPERFETISLDSISSDEEILSVGSSKKSKKHKRHHSKNKSKKKKTKDQQPDAAITGAEDQSRATRAGLTVLELLELQARARAIRAQLQQEQAAKKGSGAEEAGASSRRSSDNEVMIKEEPADVVEISSDDEKPRLADLTEKPSSTKEQSQTESTTVTKRINDLIITVPQTKQSRRIKLNRSKITVSVPNSEKTAVSSDANTSTETVAGDNGAKNIETADKEKNKETGRKKEVQKTVVKVKEKQKKKYKNKKRKAEEKDSDHDEITLQLSDTEKMDLLEDLDRKNFENVSSSGSEDSESSSSDSSSDDGENSSKSKMNGSGKSKENNKQKSKKSSGKESDLNKTNDSVEEVPNDKVNDGTKCSENKTVTEESIETLASDPVSPPKQANIESNSDQGASEEVAELAADVTSLQKDNSKLTDNNNLKSPGNSEKYENTNAAKSPKKSVVTKKKDTDKTKSPEKTVDVGTIDDIPILEEEPQAKPDSPVKEVSKNEGETDQDSQAGCENEGTQESATEKEISDGEISDKGSSEIEVFDLKPEVVCISDTEETDNKKTKSEKKKKKKEKKSKSKKSKKSKSDFRESADQNFYKDSESIDITKEDNIVSESDKISEAKATLNEADDKIGNDDAKNTVNEDITTVEENIDLTEDQTDIVIKSEDAISYNSISMNEDYDDVYEILELSDDSSCYEVEGTVLSKEPTAEEIEALSAKIDEIEREDVVTEEEIREHERRLENAEKDDDVENISWKDRYLDSKKVKRVLSTSNIFNALRKKNRDLKKKLEEAKKIEEAVQTEPVEEIQEEIVENLEEGSIEQYNTLQGSTRYVDPVQEAGKPDSEDTEGIQKNGDIQPESAETPEMVKEMRKDAKQLLKMYKRLLKYNDLNKKKDPNKKKKKKSKKKNKDGGSAVVSST